VVIGAAHKGGAMSGGSTRSMIFQATPAEAFAALRQAADRVGLQYLSGDGATGTYVYTSGMTVLAFGDKVTIRITPVTAGTVQVTVSSDLQFGVRGAMSRPDASADQLSEALGELLPRTG
jgi:hypothetical protein